MPPQLTLGVPPMEADFPKVEIFPQRWVPAVTHQDCSRLVPREVFKVDSLVVLLYTMYPLP
jgi:hypothetical protein